MPVPRRPTVPARPGRRAASLFAVCASLVLGGCATYHDQVTLESRPLTALTPAGTVEVVDTGGADQMRYRISYGDEIGVRYFQLPEYNTSVTVGPDGTVVLPFLRSVPAVGKTIDDLRDSIETNYLDLLDNAPAPEDKRYVLGVNDVLDVQFVYFPEYNTRTTVRPDGRISLPLVDTLVVEGKAPEELEADLRKLYEKHFSDPVITVSVVKAASTAVVAKGRRQRIPLAGLVDIYLRLKFTQAPKVFVGGEVRNPSALTYSPMLTSLQAILSAGGAIKGADLEKVVILRKAANGKPMYIVKDLEADIEGERPGLAEEQFYGNTPVASRMPVTNDIVLKPFDVVIVPKSGIAKVREALDQYVYDLIPPLRNSAIGFSYVRQVGEQDVKQTNVNVVP